MVAITEKKFEAMLHKWYGSGNNQGKRGGICYFPKPPYAERYKMSVIAIDRHDQTSILLFKSIQAMGWECEYEEYDCDIERCGPREGEVDHYQKMRLTFFPLFSDGRHIHTQEEIDHYNKLEQEIMEDTEEEPSSPVLNKDHQLSLF